MGLVMSIAPNNPEEIIFKITGPSRLLDHIRGFLLYVKPRPFIGCIGLGLILLFMGVYGFIFYRWFALKDVPGDLLTVFNFLIPAILFLFFLSPVKSYFNERSQSGNHTLAFMEDGIYSKLGSVEVKFAWDHCLNWQENSHVIIIRIKGKMFFIIPKWHFDSDEEQQRLKDFLVMKLEQPSNKRRQPPKAPAH